MEKLLFWIYLTNLTLLILHEIDSAYWEEWKLFKLPGGINLFLLLHIPIFVPLLYGLALVFNNTRAGNVFSYILGAAGIGAFCIHMYFIGKGGKEFKTPVSIGILGTMLVVSIAQVVITIFS